MEERKITNANAVQGKTFVNGIFGYLQGIYKTLLHGRAFGEKSKFNMHKY